MICQRCFADSSEQHNPTIALISWVSIIFARNLNPVFRRQMLPIYAVLGVLLHQNINLTPHSNAVVSNTTNTGTVQTWDV